MRLETSEIRDQKLIRRLLTARKTLQLGLWDGQEPYVVTVTFGYADNAVYFHSPLSGRKMDCIRKNGLVSFATVAHNQLTSAAKGRGPKTLYTSISGFGHARELTSVEDKTAGLDVILASDRHPAGAYDSRILEQTAVVRVELERLKGEVNPA